AGKAAGGSSRDAANASSAGIKLVMSLRCRIVRLPAS
ncbi:MAG: hypothetical protein ACI9AQ_002957, partial [Dinoroseobacter sp.]